VRSASDEIVYGKIFENATARARARAQASNAIGIINNGTCRLDDLVITASLGATVEFQLSSPMTSLTEAFTIVTIHIANECPRGDFLTGGDVCEACESGKYSLSFSVNADCQPCPLGAKCFGGDRLVVQEGWWRTGLLSDKIWQCPVTKNCLRGTESEPSRCHTGSTGPLCGVCSDGYYNSGGHECKPCGEGVSNIFFFVVGSFCIFLLVVTIAWKGHRYAYTGTRQVQMRASKLYRVSQMARLKILVVACQIISSVEASLDLKFPPPFDKLLALLSLLQFDLGLLPIACVQRALSKP